MPLPTIPASSSTVVPQTVYGAWWISQFAINATDPTNVVATVVLTKYGTDEKGNVTFSPVDDPIVFRLDQILEKSDPKSPTFDPLIAEIAGVLLVNLTEYGQKNNLI